MRHYTRTCAGLQALAWLALAACNRDEPAATAPPSEAPVVKAAEAPANDAVAPKEQRTLPDARSLAGLEISIPKGTLRVGSPTGSAGRDASREADAVELEVAAFSIDALPYPNDPARPPRALVSHEEASALCRERGQRLCSEFEWERACKGDSDQAYPSAEPYEPASCEKSATACATPLGVFAMGTLGREWTSSRTGARVGDALRSIVVKGAPKSAPQAQHRCAARDAATPDSKSESLLFRCCRGPASELKYPDEPRTEPFIEQAWDTKTIRSMLASMPETASFAQDFTLFSSEQINQRLSKSKASLTPWVLAMRGLLWSPLHGEQIGVVSGDSSGGAVLIAFYKGASGKPLFGASYQTHKEHDAILLAYKPDAPKELLFSTCWGCGGEGGALEMGGDGRVRIAPR